MHSVRQELPLQSPSGTPPREAGQCKQYDQLVCISSDSCAGRIVSADDPMNELVKLRALLDAGTLSAREYTARRLALLRQLDREAAVGAKVAAAAVRNPPASQSGQESGLVSPEEVQRALAELQSRQQELVRTRHLLAPVRRELGFAKLRRGIVSGLLGARSLADRAPLERLGSAIILSTLCAACVLVLVISYTLQPAAILGGLLEGLLIAGASVWLLFAPKDAQLLEQVSQLDQAIPELEAEAGCLRNRVAQQDASYRRARAVHERLQRILFGRRQRLLTTDWRSLRGIPFEQFLREVFQELGYTVELTKASGDQGVDLIVRREFKKIAIQAKGYGGSVGNDAVQQAFAGATFYRCQLCAVITNSNFTASARDLAREVGCVLIDATQLPNLILGRIVL